MTNPTSHFPAQNWQFIIATLNQWLGCFGVEPRAEIWHQKRQNVPLLPSINRFDFHGRRVERIGSKINKKTTLPPSFLLLAEPLSSLSLFLHHGLQPSKPSPLAWLPLLPPEELPWYTINNNTTTVKNRKGNREAGEQKPGNINRKKKQRRNRRKEEEQPPGTIVCNHTTTVNDNTSPQVCSSSSSFSSSPTSSSSVLREQWRVN